MKGKDSHFCSKPDMDRLWIVITKDEPRIFLGNEVIVINKKDKISVHDI